jgi:hypothetical protein
LIIQADRLPVEATMAQEAKILADEINKSSRLNKISAARWRNSEAGERAQSRPMPWGKATYIRGQRSSGTARRVKRARRSNVAVLATVRKGRMWRVQITAPNGRVLFFGRFSSEKGAREWIAAHTPLMIPQTESTGS